MRVYFLRHAESRYNLKNLINQNPKVDVSLTEKGRKQALALARKLRNVNFDAIYSSEFPRAKQTTEIINKFHDLKVKIDERVNEIRVGFEGKTDKEHNAAYKDDPFNFKLPGKESWQDLKKRIGVFLRALKKKEHNTVLVVTHQWCVRVANQIVNSLDDEEAFYTPVKNGDFFMFRLK